MAAIGFWKAGISIVLGVSGDDQDGFDQRGFGVFLLLPPYLNRPATQNGHCA
jgi:hypothetical protein